MERQNFVTSEEMNANVVSRGTFQKFRDIIGRQEKNETAREHHTKLAITCTLVLKLISFN